MSDQEAPIEMSALDLSGEPDLHGVFTNDQMALEQIVPETQEEVLPGTKTVSKEEREKVLVEMLVAEAKKSGRTFDSDEAAYLWGKQKLFKKLEKDRLRGRPIACVYCNRGGSNALTGPLQKIGIGYAHVKCMGN